MKKKLWSFIATVKRDVNSMNCLKVFMFLVILTIAGGCYSVKLITPTENDVARVKDKYPDYTITDLNRGKTLFENNCGKCHPYKNPASKTEEEWIAIIPKMSAKANKKSLVIDDLAQQDILRYVITMRGASR